MLFDMARWANELEVLKRVITTILVDMMNNHVGVPTPRKLALPRGVVCNLAASPARVVVPLPDQFSNSRG